MVLRHCVLQEPMFRVTAPSGTVTRLSLPEVLARLSAAEDLVFTALRPHQRAAWHAFNVQLAVLALESSGREQLAKTADDWRALLRTLTADYPDDAPWHLVVEDWGRPAFLQSPCSPARVADFKHGSDSAQDIDVLVTSRHHDEKAGKLPLCADEFDTLLYALVGLQGWTPFLGAGNYNSMRMNGGFSSRPQFRLAVERGSGAEFRRDVEVLLAGLGPMAEAFAVRHDGAVDPEHRLLWLPPWDEEPLPLASVHPLALEVARRVRLVEREGSLQLLRAASKSMRVDAKASKGDVLDPWMPILRDGGRRALTAQSHTLGYRTLQGLLFDRQKCELPLLALPAEHERSRPTTLIAQVLVNGDGRTDGLLQREIAMPASVTRRLGHETVDLARRSQLFVDRAGEMSGKVFRSALIQFIDGSPDVDWKNKDFDRASRSAVDDYERDVDEAFFIELFRSIDAGQDDQLAQQHWVQWLYALAQRRLPAATAALPTRSPSRTFAQARAERVLHGGARKHFGTWLAHARAAVPNEDTQESMR